MAASLTRVAVLQRRIGASLEGVWENVLDWEHLPWLHDASFLDVECLEAGPAGWRVRAQLPGRSPRSALIELKAEREAGRYVARTLEGHGRGTEIWTRLRPSGPDETDIEVEFWLPDVAPERVDRVGAAYLALYERLWDEDEAMMIERAERLAGPRASAPPGASLELGPLDGLRRTLPRVVDLAGHPIRLVEVGGELIAHSALCPHRLGPLVETPPDAPEEVRCPWHGYRFDVRSGHSVDGRSLRLGCAPEIAVDARGTVVLRMPERGSARATPSAGEKANERGEPR